MTSTPKDEKIAFERWLVLNDYTYALACAGSVAEKAYRNWAWVAWKARSELASEPYSIMLPPGTDLSKITVSLPHPKDPTG